MKENLPNFSCEGLGPSPPLSVLGPIVVYPLIIWAQKGLIIWSQKSCFVTMSTKKHPQATQHTMELALLWHEFESIVPIGSSQHKICKVIPKCLVLFDQ